MHISIKVVLTFIGVPRLCRIESVLNQPEFLHLRDSGMFPALWFSCVYVLCMFVWRACAAATGIYIVVKTKQGFQLFWAFMLIVPCNDWTWLTFQREGRGGYTDQSCLKGAIQDFSQGREVETVCKVEKRHGLSNSKTGYSLPTSLFKKTNAVSINRTKVDERIWPS